jgi:hypothetical protein
VFRETVAMARQQQSLTGKPVVDPITLACRAIERSLTGEFCGPLVLDEGAGVISPLQPERGVAVPGGVSRGKGGKAGTLLRVVAVSGNPDVRAALGKAQVFTLACEGDGDSRAEIRVEMDGQRRVTVRETSRGKSWEHHLHLAEEAQVRYGVDSPMCGETPVLPLREALQLIASDPAVFKIMFHLEDRQLVTTTHLTLRECFGTWIVYGFSPGKEDCFQVIPGMPLWEEIALAALVREGGAESRPGQG